MPYSISEDTDMWIGLTCMLQEHAFVTDELLPRATGKGHMYLLVLFPFSEKSPLRTLIDTAMTHNSYGFSYPTGGPVGTSPLTRHLWETSRRQMMEFSHPFQGYAHIVTPLLDAELAGMPVHYIADQESKMGAANPSLADCIKDNVAYCRNQTFILRGFNPHLIEPSVPPIPCSLFNFSSTSSDQGDGRDVRTHTLNVVLPGSKTVGLGLGRHSLPDVCIRRAIRRHQESPYFGRRAKKFFHIRDVVHYTPGIELEDDIAVDAEKLKAKILAENLVVEKAKPTPPTTYVRDTTFTVTTTNTVTIV